MKPLRSCQTCKMSFFRSIKDPEPYRFTFEGKSSVKLSSIVLGYPLWKFFASVVSAIKRTLLVGCQPEIIPLVVEDVAVPVVHFHAGWDFDTHQRKDHKVKVESPLNSTDPKRHHFVTRAPVCSVSDRSSYLSGRVPIVPIPFPFSLEVRKRPFLPANLAIFRIVRKTLGNPFLECYGNLRRKLSFLCHCFTGFEFRAEWEVRSLLGSFLLTRRTVEASA